MVQSTTKQGPKVELIFWLATLWLLILMVRTKQRSLGVMVLWLVEIRGKEEKQRFGAKKWIGVRVGGVY